MDRVSKADETFEENLARADEARDGDPPVLDDVEDDEVEGE